jgi:hypothetical protein
MCTVSIYPKKKCFFENPVYFQNFYYNYNWAVMLTHF